jgi:hypothetical protein
MTHDNYVVQGIETKKSRCAALVKGLLFVQALVHVSQPPLHCSSQLTTFTNCEEAIAVVLLISVQTTSRLLTRLFISPQPNYRSKEAYTSPVRSFAMINWVASLVWLLACLNLISAVTVDTLAINGSSMARRDTVDVSSSTQLTR